MRWRRGTSNMLSNLSKAIKNHGDRIDAVQSNVVSVRQRFKRGAQSMRNGNRFELCRQAQLYMIPQNGDQTLAGKSNRV